MNNSRSKFDLRKPEILKNLFHHRHIEQLNANPTMHLNLRYAGNDIDINWSKSVLFCDVG